MKPRIIWRPGQRNWPGYWWLVRATHIKSAEQLRLQKRAAAYVVELNAKLYRRARNKEG